MSKSVIEIIAITARGVQVLTAVGITGYGIYKFGVDFLDVVNVIIKRVIQNSSNIIKFHVMVSVILYVAGLVIISKLLKPYSDGYDLSGDKTFDPDSSVEYVKVINNSVCARIWQFILLILGFVPVVIYSVFYLPTEVVIGLLFIILVLVKLADFILQKVIKSAKTKKYYYPVTREFYEVLRKNKFLTNKKDEIIKNLMSVRTENADSTMAKQLIELYSNGTPLSVDAIKIVNPEKHYGPGVRLYGEFDDLNDEKERLGIC